MKYVIGVDHGGTKTKAIIADLNGNIVADHTILKNEAFDYSGINVTSEAIMNTLKKASLTVDEIVCCTIGFSGADWDFEYPLIKEKLIKATGIDCCYIVNDCIGAMRGGLDKTYGGVVCIGTGLNVGLINTKGESFIYGYLINDEDSGAYALGQKVIRAVRNELIGIGEKTLLTEMVLQYFNSHYGANLKNAYEMFIAISTGSSEIPKLSFEVKNLAPILTKAATTDKVAFEIMNEFCRNLTDYVFAASKRLNLTDTEYDVVLSGGVMKSGGLIKESFCKHMKACLPHVNVKVAEYEPVCGAVILCYDTLKAGENVISVFKNNCYAAGFTLVQMCERKTTGDQNNECYNER